MLGTLLAAVVSLFLLGLFPQERWLFMTGLSTYLGFCAYMMSKNKSQYFWMVSGFVSVIICTAGPDPTRAFHLAMTRTQETGLGILVYSVVALLLWPVSSRSQFAKATDTLASTQQQILAALLKSLEGKSENETIQALRVQLLQAQAQFSHLLEAAISDTYDVWEVRQKWRRYAVSSGKLTECMERLWESLDALKDIDAHQLVLNLNAVNAELNMRLCQVQRMLTCQLSEQKPLPMTIVPAADMVRALPPLQRAALLSVQIRFTELFQLTQTLYNIVSTLRGGDQIEEIPEPAKTNSCFLPDPDGLKGSFVIMLNMWLAYLAVIYIDGLPGGYGVLAVTGSLALGLVSMPQLPMKFVYRPVATGLLIGALSYICIMPHLSSFYELSLLVFAGVFGFCYLCSEPKQMLGKATGLSLFFTLTTISNHQSYNFLAVTTTGLMFFAVVLLLTYSVHIPFSLRAEKVFLRLLRRYFQSCQFLMSRINMSSAQPQSWFQRLIYSYHLREIETLPQKISTWIPFIDPRHLPGTTPQRVQAVQTSVLALSYRIQELLEEQRIAHSLGLKQDVHLIFGDWHQVIRQEFTTLAAAPATTRVEQFRQEMSEVVKRFEERTQYLFDNTNEMQNSEEDSVRFYRLLGACRGVSEALLRYTANAAAIDWQPWQEGRF